MWTLEDLGWDAQRREEMVAQADGLSPARIAVVHREGFVLYGAAGELRARLAGRLRHAGEDATIGDWVAAAPAEGGDSRVEAVLTRRTALVRRQAGTRDQPQVLAANVDVVFVVAGLDGDFNPRRVERTLVLVAQSGARAVVLLNKADACADVAARLDAMRRVTGDVPVHVVSALLGDGMEAVRGHVRPGTTLALIGSSGAGKSTLANRLLGVERQATAAVREDDSRGRHTTTRRELLVLPGGGVLIDTPGLRELQMWGTADAADPAFGDVETLAADCRFSDCRHDREPGCAVTEAAADGRLDAGRLAGYRKLRAELRHIERQHDAQARSEEERRWRTIHKAARRHRPRW